MIHHSGQVNKANILAGNYATSTSGTEATGTANDTSNSSSNGSLSKSENVTRNLTGKDGNKSYEELISEYRQNIIDVDSRIIEELNSLFFGLY